MVDFDHLESWPLDRILKAQGFTCKGCGRREAISVTDASLDEAMRNLDRYPPGHKKLQFLIAKAVRKAESLHLRGEAHGALERPDVAST